jgi:hypothetical protein
LDGSEIQVEGKFVPLLQDINKEISRNSSVNERTSLDRRCKVQSKRRLIQFSKWKFGREGIQE